MTFGRNIQNTLACWFCSSSNLYPETLL